MISSYMIMTALATTALAKGSTECRFSEPTGARQCFGAVGQLLMFHLPNTANTEVKLKKDNKYIILKIVKNQIVTQHEEYMNQSELFTNGTFKLGNAMKRHSGDYRLEEFGSNGTLLKEVNVHLEIQAPVSKPAVSQMCLSPEQMNISCSSEGDGVEFILTLDGLLLMQTTGHSQSLSSWTANMQSLAGSKPEQDKPSVSTVTISLQGQLTGNVMCRAWNNVSRDETVIHLKSCKAVTSHFPVAAAVRAGVVTLLLLALCLCICRVHKKTRLMTVKEEHSWTNEGLHRLTQKRILNE
ncbi:uncharacterized protein LOC122888710 [Siniperca chuatsi]|uniref:uncharacterized protein LOC122888710 n=1 Tax=Siniperca chuatsi TaxID=119488 RepID=UPI001CE14394|nr:uncharacterized protein LOC122888710 [Siniperca chuatsi]